MAANLLRMERLASFSHDSERFVRQAMDLAPGMLYVFDVVESKSLYVSAHVVQATGYSADEIIGFGSSFLDRLIHDDDRAAVSRHQAALNDFEEGRSARVEYRLRHRDGFWRWFESNDAPYLRDPDGRLRQVIGIAVDVTARKHAEEALSTVAHDNRFRANLADALRNVEGPLEAQRVAADTLGRHLGVTRAHYADVVDGARYGVVNSDYCDGVPSMVGRYRLDDYGPAVMDELRAGRTVEIDDVQTDARLGERQKTATAVLGIGAYVVAPLMRAGRPVAALVVQQSRPRRWSDEEVRLVEETLERTGATAESSRVRAAAATRQARYQKLFESIDEGFCLGEIIVDESGQAVDYRFLEVNRRFEEQTGLADAVGKTACELVPNLERHWVDTYARVGLGGETLRFEEGSESMGRWFDVYAAPVDPVGCGQFVLVFKDASDRKRAERALQRTRYRAQLIADVVGALDSLDTVSEMAERFVEVLVPRFADYASLEIPDRSEPVLAVAHRNPEMLPTLRTLHERHRLERDEANSVARAAAGEAQLIGHIAPEVLREYARDEQTLELLSRLGPRSHIAVPVDVLGDRGVLLAGLSDPTRDGYTDHELEIAQEVARRVGVLLARTRVREDEHSIAVRLQQALLPEDLPDHPSVQVAASYQTGSAVLEVGGDWYDALVLPGGRIAFSVGDVVGHGLEAAAAMARLRVALAAVALHSEVPADVLTRLDEFSRGPGRVDFATAFYAVLDSATGVVWYAAAGHPPALVVSMDGTTRWLDGGRGTPLGIAGGAAPRTDASLALRSGDLVIAYSDGLVERRGESIAAGLDRLESVARTLFASPVAEVCRRLSDALITDSSNDDDVVVICLRFSPVTAAGFTRVLPARPEELAPARAALRTWLAEHHPTADGADLLIAVGEGLSNAVEHAYADGSPGVVRLSVVMDAGGEARVEVQDYGRWKPETAGSDRGRGTPVMLQLAGEFTRNTGDGGTTVTFTMPVRRPVSA